MSKARTRRLESRAKRYAAIFLRGARMIDAWRQVTPGWEKLELQSQHNNSSEFAKHPIVAKALDDAARDMEVRDVDSHVRYHADVRERAVLAIERDNLTAATQWDRLRGQSLGVLVENMSVTMAPRGGDDEIRKIIARIAELSPAMARQAAVDFRVDMAALTDQREVIDVKELAEANG